VLPAEEIAEVFGIDADVAEISVEQLYEPVASASRGIWRVRIADRSAVLKLVAHSDGGSVNWRSGADPSHWYYWRREVLAYDSGLLGSLPGRLRAPRCYAATARDDGSVALWLEDLGGASAAAWPIERYGDAARHLGETQGSYLVNRPLPTDAWLSRGWLRSYLAQREGDFALLEEPVAASFPRATMAAAIALRDDRAQLLDILDQMPRTLCHLDLHPANLFSGEDVTVAIDWSFVGLGAIGEDAGNLVPDSVLDFHVEPDHITDLYELVSSEYDAGLRAAGWDGPEHAVRLAMSATIAAKYVWILPALLRAALDGRELVNGRPADETLRWWTPAVDFIHERGEEARTLARRVT
jgi:hypothetical protein